jgi:hypothetical protein
MMDIRERIDDFREMIEAAMDHRQTQMWTNMPVRIESYDAEKQTVKMTPLIKATVRDPEGKITRVELPQLEDVPVQFAGGGGATMTFPIKKGDEGIALFSSRSIDAWHQSGGIQQQTAARMHDLSDGFFVPGIRSQPRRLKNVSASSVQLRSDDDDAKTSITIDPVNHSITHKVGTGASALSYTHSENGIQYTIPAGKKMTVNGKRIDAEHKHSDVTPGGGETGFPIAMWWLIYAGPWALIAYDLLGRFFT